MKLIAVFLMILLVLMIAKTYVFSFRFQSPKNYAETGPQFDLKTQDYVMVIEDIIGG